MSDRCPRCQAPRSASLDSNSPCPDCGHEQGNEDLTVATGPVSTGNEDLTVATGPVAGLDLGNEDLTIASGALAEAGNEDPTVAAGPVAPPIPTAPPAETGSEDSTVAAAPPPPTARPASVGTGGARTQKAIARRETRSIKVPAERLEDIALAGEILRAGQASLREINEALAESFTRRRRLPEVLEEKGTVDRQQIGLVLESADFRRSVGGDPSTGSRTRVVRSDAGAYTLIKDGDLYYFKEQAQLRSFGSYEIIDEIARGGMGIVYKARQVGLDRIVALKVLLAGDASSEIEIQRFLREARTVATLDHPGIVPIYDIGEVDEQYYFTMEYIPGPTLSKVIKTGRPTIRESLSILHAICEAVASAHDGGIIHRDLKPGNVLIDAKGRPRVTDFGLAKDIDSQSQLTQEGSTLGTPAYMSPEQAIGESADLGPPSDVYALGAILYELLTGQVPHKADHMLQLMYFIAHVDPTPMRKIDPSIHHDLETICAKAMAKEASRRYPTAGHLAADLANFLEGRQIAAVAPGRLYRVRRFVRRHRAASAVGALALVLLAVGGTVGTRFYLQERAARRTSEAERLALVEERSAAFERRQAAKPDHDKGVLLRLNGRPAEALAAFDEAIAADPTFDAAHLERALVLRQFDRRREALQSLADAIEASPENYAAYNERAGLLGEMERFDEAIDDYDRILSLRPDDVVALVNRAATLEAAGRTEEALADLGRALTIQPDSAAALHNRAAILHGIGRVDEALADFRKAWARDELRSGYQVGRILLETDRPGEALPLLDQVAARIEVVYQRSLDVAELRRLYARVLLARGSAHLALADPERALADATRSVELEPDIVPARILRGHALLALDRAEDAVDEFSSLFGRDIEAEQVALLLARAYLVVGRFERALDEVARSIGDEPPSAEALALRGRALAGLERWAEAGRDLDAAVDRGQPPSTVARSRARVALVAGDWARARELLAGGDGDRISSVLNFVAAVGEGATGAADLLADIEDADWLTGALRPWIEDWQAEDPERALRLVEAALERSPSAGFLLARLVVLEQLALRGAGDDLRPRQAEACRALLAVDPENLEALRLLAGQAFDAGEDGEARALLDRAIAADRSRGDLYVLRAEVLQRQNESLDAVRDLGTALNLDPSDRGARLQLGLVYHAMQSFDRSLALLDEVLAEDPAEPDALLTRALIRASDGELRAALVDLDGADAARPGSPAILYNRGVVHTQLGNRTAGRADFEAVLDADPDHPAAARALRALGGR